MKLVYYEANLVFVHDVLRKLTSTASLPRRLIARINGVWWSHGDLWTERNVKTFELCCTL